MSVGSVPMGLDQRTTDNGLLAQHLNLQTPLSRPIQFSQYDALKLSQHHFPIGYRQNHTVVEKQTAQVRRRILPVTIGKLGRVVLVGQIVRDDTTQKTCDIVDQGILIFADHQRRRCVLGVQTDHPVPDSGMRHEFPHPRRNVDQLLFFGRLQTQSLQFCFHDSLVARIKASM